MIDDLDRTLKKLLEQEVPGLTEAAQNVLFDAPDRDFHPPLPAVDLFLYDVRENRDLRSNEWAVQRHGSSATQTPPPVRVDCSYLITAWAGDTASEHLLLSQVLAALVKYPVLPANVLQGTLVDQELPLPAGILQPAQLQSVAEFWQALGGKPRAALHYTVTISLQAAAPVEARIVEEKVLEFTLIK